MLSFDISSINIQLTPQADGKIWDCKAQLNFWTSIAGGKSSARIKGWRGPRNFQDNSGKLEYQAIVNFIIHSIAQKIYSAVYQGHLINKMWKE